MSPCHTGNRVNFHRSTPPTTEPLPLRAETNLSCPVQMTVTTRAFFKPSKLAERQRVAVEATASSRVLLGCSTRRPLPSSVLFQVGVHRADGVKEHYAFPKMNTKTAGAPLSVGGVHLEHLVGPPKGPTRRTKSTPLPSSRLENANVLE